MPYIKQGYRMFWDTLYSFHAVRIASAGELNYLITKMFLCWLNNKPSYDKYNTLLGVLEGVKLELYRRQISIYEDEKKEINGEIYDT